MSFLTGGARLIAPELTMAAASFLLLGMEAVRPGRRAASLGWAAAACAAAAVLACAGPEGAAYGFLAVDAPGRILKVLVLGGLVMIMGLSWSFSGFRDREGEPFAWGTYAALLLLAGVGLLFLTSTTDFLMALIALELVSVSSFVLTGFVREDRRASEAAMKYFLAGAFASGLMVYGISLLYGLTGTTGAQALGAAADLPALPVAGALFFILAGFGFKLALAPFHMWAPDVYEGAPTPVTAFLSVAPKIAAFGMMVRLLAAHPSLPITPLLAAVAALTMTVGNLGALRQTNLKRLFAYSSIAQMGYVMIGFVAAGPTGFRAVWVYLAAYLFMNVGAFASLTAVTEDARTESIDAFAGLSSRSLPLALTTTFFLLSLTGIPPFIGFIGKFGLFASALKADGLVWLAVVGVVNSVVSFAYYFSIVRAMFFTEARRSDRVPLPAPVLGCLGVALAVTVVLGLFPDALVHLVHKAIP